MDGGIDDGEHGWTTVNKGQTVGNRGRTTKNGGRTIKNGGRRGGRTSASEFFTPLTLIC